MNQSKEDSQGKISLFWSLIVLVTGLVFQFANFDLITYRQVINFWPVLLIAFGMKILINFFFRERNDEKP